MRNSNQSSFFLHYVGGSFLNGHGVAVFQHSDGRITVHHERYGKQSKLFKSFENAELYDRWLDSLDVNAGTNSPDRVYNKARLLDCALHNLGVNGFK